MKIFSIGICSVFPLALSANVDRMQIESNRGDKNLFVYRTEDVT